MPCAAARTDRPDDRFAAVMWGIRRAALLAGMLLVGASGSPSALIVDYPEDGSIFPPEITAPQFLWRDSDKTARSWRIDISFADGAPAIHTVSRGASMRIGPLDPDCVAETNEPPRLTPQQAAAHTWTPDAAMWAVIKKHSVAGPATVTITGPASRASIRIATSQDPAGAPIFYRDVPLMPSELERGVIKPLAAAAVPLVAWRVRNLAEPASHVVMENLPVCANCHSFSADGRTLGMDLDGWQNNRGLYILASVGPQTSVSDRDLVQWSTAQGALKGSARAGFLSQVSPDGRFVVTTIDPLRDATSNYYVANFKDYRFLQVFYPTRGILSWYNKSAGILQPLPGADDPRFVQMGAVWSPDGQSLVFARATACDPSTSQPLAQFANDPNELPLQYDLYRVPFRSGAGGRAEPIAGASANGMSNSFPKVSPDGRWIVFVKSRNGLLMRPDSQLYIVPAGGGEARRMRCNTSLMNSWHSFSPNGRWLVFSSKSRSPYTQMYLTHIDEEGNDSPAILVDNSTAANRAVNLPEFVNVAPDGLRQIGGPALEYYRRFNSAMYLQKKGQIPESIAMWREVLSLKPGDALAHSYLGAALLLTGHRDEAGVHMQKAAELKLRTAVADRPTDAAAYRALGHLLLERGQVREAEEPLRRAVELDPASAVAHTELGIALRQSHSNLALHELRQAVGVESLYTPALYNLGLALDANGQTDEAIQQWERALAIDAAYTEVHDVLGQALYAQGKIGEALSHWREGTNSLETLRRTAWILATNPNFALRNGDEAIARAIRAVQLSGGKDAAVWDTLAAAYAETGRFEDAIPTAARALEMARQDHREELAEAIRTRIRLYEAHQPYREKPVR